MLTTFELIQIMNEFNFSYSANGYHSFKMYFHYGRMIKYSDYLLYRRLGVQGLTTRTHFGIKQQLNGNFWLFALFTSKSHTVLYDGVIMNNLPLLNNIHEFVNPAIIILNSHLAEYTTVSNNLFHGPSYLRQLTSIDIVNYSARGFKQSVELADFNNIFVLVNELYKYHLNLGPNTSSILHNTRNNYNLHYDYLAYQRKLNYLHQLGIRNSDLIEFVENYQNNLTLRGKNYASHDLFRENSNRRFKD